MHAGFCPAFGASRHVAGALLTAMKHDPRIRASMNIHCSKEILATAKKLGYVIGNYDRNKEPKDVKAAEGASIPWGVAQAITAAGRVPDIIYHRGDTGKEPMINIFGKDAVEVAIKAIKLSRHLESKEG